MKPFIIICAVLCAVVSSGKITPAFLAASSAVVSATETGIWKARVLAAGGTLGGSSESIAQALSDQLAAASYSAKIVYLLPFLGSNMTAARVPLRDTLGVGIAYNGGFVDADFSEATGLANNNSAKYLNSFIKPSQLGTSNNGGLGWWETNIGFGSDVEPMGCYSIGSTNRYVLDLRTTFQRVFWGTAIGQDSPSASAGNHHYYGQRSSSTSRAIFKNGAKIGEDITTTDSTSGAADRTIWVHGVNSSPATFWSGRCAVAYLTDGTMSDADIAAFHTLLQTYLITPTGR